MSPVPASPADPSPARRRPAQGSAVRLTGRGAVIGLFVPCFAILLIGYGNAADLTFVFGCGVMAYYVRPTGLLPMVACPPLVFFVACVCAKAVTSAGLLATAEGIGVTMANAAPWLFAGTALTVLVALGRGLGPQVRNLLGAQR